MNIETRKKGDVVIVDFQGRLAVGVGEEMLPRLIEQLLNEGSRKILLNLSNMDYIDSNGLGELVQSLKTSKQFGASASARTNWGGTRLRSDRRNIPRRPDASPSATSSGTPTGIRPTRRGQRGRSRCRAETPTIR